MYLILFVMNQLTINLIKSVPIVGIKVKHFSGQYGADGSLVLDSYAEANLSPLCPFCQGEYIPSIISMIIMK
jgi:hypothetical protein